MWATEQRKKYSTSEQTVTQPKLTSSDLAPTDPTLSRSTPPEVTPRPAEADTRGPFEGFE